MNHLHHSCCWHSTNKILLSSPPMLEKVCCWCGDIKHIVQKPPYDNCQNHGIYHPMRLVALESSTPGEYDGEQIEPKGENQKNQRKKIPSDDE